MELLLIDLLAIFLGVLIYCLGMAHDMKLKEKAHEDYMKYISEKDWSMPYSTIRVIESKEG